MPGWLFGAVHQVGKFLYPNAGHGAQPEVQRAIARFRRLPERERARRSLWAWLLGEDGTPPYKMAKNDIVWTEHPVNGQSCANCQRYYIHFVTGIGISEGPSVSA